MSALAIPLQAQSPQPATPLQTIGDLMQLRGQMSEIALRQAQVEQARQQQQLTQVEQAQKNRDLADQNALAEKEKDPAFMQRLYGGDLTALSGLGLQDKTVQALNTHINDTISKKATTDKAVLENQSAALGRLKDTAINLTAPDAEGNAPDLATVNSRYSSAAGEIADLAKKSGIDAQLPGAFGSLDDVRNAQARLHALQGATDAALAQKKSRADIVKSEGEGAAGEATAALNNFKLGLMKGMDANTVASSVDALIDPVKFPQANKDAHAAAAVARLSGDPAKVAEAVQGIYNEQVGKPAGAAATVTAETPAKVAQGAAMIPVEAATAAARANAEIPAKVKEQAALAANSPEMFAGIGDVSTRRTVQSDYQKLTEAYLDKAQSAQQLKDFISAAQSGNKAAPGLIPLSELRSIVNRVNRSELDAVSSGAGSLLDRVQGAINHQTEGQPIPPDILKGIGQIADIENRNSRSVYENKVSALGSTYGGHVKPVNPPAPAHVQQADTADIGAVIPMPGNRFVKKTGQNAFIETDQAGNPVK